MKNELQDLYNIIDSHGDFHCFNIIDYINQLIKDNQDLRGNKYEKDKLRAYF